MRGERAAVTRTRITDAAREASLGHLLLITSNTGAMEFRTGRSQVVGSNLVTKEHLHPLPRLRGAAGAGCMAAMEVERYLEAEGH